MPAGNADVLDALRQVLDERAPLDLTPGVTVTVGETSDPEIDRKVLCQDCIDGDTVMVRKVPDKRALVQATAVPGSYDERGRLGAVKRTITYNQDRVLAGLKAGTHGKQCIHCGSAL